MVQMRNAPLPSAQPSPIPRASGPKPNGNGHKTLQPSPSQARRSPPARPALGTDPKVRAAHAKANQPHPGGRIAQRYSWGVLDSKDKNNQIVHGNIARATKSNNADIVTDPNKIKSYQNKVSLSGGEVVHIHAHGAEDRVAGFGANSFATELKKKFADLKGRTIMFHSCEVGQKDYLKNLLTALMDDEGKEWDGTRVLAPKRFLIVDNNGISIVSRDGVKESALSTRQGRRGALVKKGEDWTGYKVKGGAIVLMGQDETKEAVKTAMTLNR